MIVEGMPSRRFGRNPAASLTALALLAGTAPAGDKIARTERVETRFGTVGYGLTGEQRPGTAFVRFKEKQLLEESVPVGASA